MLDALGRAYPGMLIDEHWFILTDTEGLKDWSVSEALGRFDDFEREITSAIPGAQVSSAIITMLENFRDRSFFTRVPLLLLTAVLVATVLFFLTMMVSVLVRRREEDASLLRTRGAGLAAPVPPVPAGRARDDGRRHGRGASSRDGPGGRRGVPARLLQPRRARPASP